MARDRNRLCIEVRLVCARTTWVSGPDLQDPFEITYNVARTVTKDGLYTIRGEFMRATRVRYHCLLPRHDSDHTY